MPNLLQVEIIHLYETPHVINPAPRTRLPIRDVVNFDLEPKQTFGAARHAFWSNNHHCVFGLIFIA